VTLLSEAIKFLSSDILKIRGLFWCNLLHVFYFTLFLHYLVYWMRQEHEAVRFLKTSFLGSRPQSSLNTQQKTLSSQAQAC